MRGGYATHNPPCLRPSAITRYNPKIFKRMNKMFTVRQVKAAFGLEESDLQLPKAELEKKLSEVKLHIGKTKTGLYMWRVGCVTGPASKNAYETASRGDSSNIAFEDTGEGSLVCRIIGDMEDGVSI